MQHKKVTELLDEAGQYARPLEQFILHGGSAEMVSGKLLELGKGLSPTTIKKYRRDRAGKPVHR